VPKSAWSSDEEEEGEEEEEKTPECDAKAAEAAALVALEHSLGLEFSRCFKMYCKTAREIKWAEVLKEQNLAVPVDRAITWKDLWAVDMGKVLKKFFIEPDKTGELYGFLPKMATASKCSIGAFGASSFCERINSAANLILTKGNTLLGDAEIDKLVVLRMNRDFMAFMRKYYPDVVKCQEFGETVITEDDC
jgi:hypothetical protein